MKKLHLLAGLVSLTVLAAQNQVLSPNKGVIYGTAIAPDGTPAKELTLNALPLGVALAMVLPWTKTNEVGAYRFEHLPLGRYTVYAEDKAAGYSNFSTGVGGPGHPREVELTAEHPEAEFDLQLPPQAGFLLFHLTNRSTGAPISGSQVTVLSQELTPTLIFSMSCSSTEPILVPSNKDLLLHVTAMGFLEWKQTIGTGMPLHIAPGGRLTLDVQLQPANPLTERIPDADPKKYQGIHDAKDWRNPYLIVRADGFEVAGVSDAKIPLTVDEVTTILQGLSVSAWPYGRVVAIQVNGLVGSESEQSRMVESRNLLSGRLGELGVIVGFWPSA